MLAGISNEQYLILRADLFEKFAHLFRGCQRRFIEHVKMFLCGVGIAAAGEEALQRVGRNTGIVELPRCAGGGGESLDGIAILFRSLTDAFEGRGLSRTSQSTH